MIISRDNTFKIVCNIRTPKDGNDIVGTGVFISKGSRAYLVTATHVSTETNKDTYIVYCDKRCDAYKRRLCDLNSKMNWINHSIEDISILEIDTANNMDLLNERCFPRGLGAEGKFSPFTFRSYASSSLITFLRADTATPAEFFCLENPSVGGYSGGPVFDLGIMIVGAMTTTKEKTCLQGIMHGTILDSTGGKIALVSPAWFIKDLI